MKKYETEAARPTNISLQHVLMQWKTADRSVHVCNAVFLLAAAFKKARNGVQKMSREQYKQK